MGKHTPGPWSAGRSDLATMVDRIPSKWVYAGDQYVATASGRIEGGWDEVMANARLIAAAPELLEALEKLVGVAEQSIYPKPDVGSDHPYAILCAAKDAIAKATGKTGGEA